MTAAAESTPSYTVYSGIYEGDRDKGAVVVTPRLPDDVSFNLDDGKDKGTTSPRALSFLTSKTPAPDYTEIHFTGYRMHSYSGEVTAEHRAEIIQNAIITGLRKSGYIVNDAYSPALLRGSSRSDEPVIAACERYFDDMYGSNIVDVVPYL